MRMKKKLFILILLAFYLPVFLCAQVRVVDNAGLLSGSDKAALERQLAEIASKYNFDLVIVTETNIGNATTADYAEDFYISGGYGYGSGADGSLFLQVTGSRDYYFKTSGRGVKILNNTAYGKLESEVRKFLRNDDPAGAYRAFISRWEKFLILDAKGRSYNFFHRWNSILVIIVWVISFLIGFLVVYKWKKKMNTAAPKNEADPYAVSDSLAFTEKQEKFLYSSVSKTQRSAQSSSSLVSGNKQISPQGRMPSGRGGKY